MNEKADFGLVGLAVMGENLVLNVESRGFTVAVFNRTLEKVDNFVHRPGEGEKNYRDSLHCRACRFPQDTAQDHVDGESGQAGG